MLRNNLLPPVNEVVRSNVFSRVSHSVQDRFNVTIAHDALEPYRDPLLFKALVPPQPHALQQGPSPGSPLYNALALHPDMFRLVQLGPQRTRTYPLPQTWSNLFIMKHSY